MKIKSKKIFRKGGIFNYINNLINEFDIVKKEILSKGELLKRGRYKVISLSKTIVFKDSAAKEFIEKQAIEWSLSFPIIKLYIKKLISIFFGIKISPIETEKQGDFALLTQGGDLKIFDITTNAVLHSVKSDKKYKNIKRNYDHFSLFFASPIQCFNDDKKLITESLIGFTKLNILGKSDCQLVFETYFKIFNSQKWPFIKCHGDFY